MDKEQLIQIIIASKNKDHQAFEKLAHPTMPIAVKMFAMELLYRTCLKEPDLKHELLLLIDAQFEEGSAGFKSRAKRVRKGLEKVSSVPGASFSCNLLNDSYVIR